MYVHVQIYLHMYMHINADSLVWGSLGLTPTRPLLYLCMISKGSVAFKNHTHNVIHTS